MFKMKSVLSLGFLMLSFLILTAPVQAQTAADLSSTGEQLEREMWDAIKNQNIIEIQNMLADDFQSIHKDGPRDKNAEIGLIEGLNVKEYFLSNFKVTQNGNTIVVTYNAAVQENIAGQTTPPVPTPRLSVWEKNDKGIWQWVAHANLEK